MIENERLERVVAVGHAMLTAARTAPKGKGVDILECALVTGDDIRRLSESMLELHRLTGRGVYARDGHNILQADAVVVIATRSLPLGLNCAHCGFPTCDEKPANVPCAVNCVDVGIAIGMAAERLNLLPGCSQYYCIPLSATSKNPFFDRQ